MSALPNYSPTFSKLRPVCGLCCIMCNLDFTLTECIGCHLDQHLLCCHAQETCLKCTREPFYDFICCRNNVACGPCGCIRSNCQCFCIDARCALPTNKLSSNPCILTIFGVTVYVAGQSVCACCASFEKLYSDTRQPMPSITVEMLAVNPNEAQQPRRESIAKKEKKDIGDIVNRVVNDGHAGNDSGYDLNRVETAGDDAFYAVDTAHTDNNNV